MAEEAPTGEGGEMTVNGTQAAPSAIPAVPQPSNDIEKGGAAAPEYVDDDPDRGTISVFTFLKIVSIPNNSTC